MAETVNHSILKTSGVSKSFTMHTQDGACLSVLKDVSFELSQGDCVALIGDSGSGKSTFMRMLYANYTCQSGEIWVKHRDDWIDLCQANPHQILDMRKHTIGYVSQFLRVIPRVSTLDIVADPLISIGETVQSAQNRACELLTQLNIPERLWSLSPMTFSGGEQQRVNIARGFIRSYPIMLLDEPTASLDAGNREVVLDLIRAAQAQGSAIIGIFHDQIARDAVCTSEFHMKPAA